MPRRAAERVEMRGGKSGVTAWNGAPATGGQIAGLVGSESAPWWKRHDVRKHRPFWKSRQIGWFD